LVLLVVNPPLTLTPPWCLLAYLAVKASDSPILFLVFLVPLVVISP
jgi:hypothetical protein